jgi:hypothetical protein
MYIGKAPFVLTGLKRLTQLTIHLVPCCLHDFCTKWAIPSSIHVIGKFLHRGDIVSKRWWDGSQHPGHQQCTNLEWPYIIPSTWNCFNSSKIRGGLVIHRFQEQIDIHYCAWNWTDRKDHSVREGPFSFAINSSLHVPLVVQVVM